MAQETVANYKPPKISWKVDFRKNWPVYVLMLPSIIYLVVLHFLPMFGIVMAFENFKVATGYFGSQWVGFQNFIDLFTGEQFPIALRNTICIALIRVTLGFLPPIIFACLLSLVEAKRFKRFCQTLSYLPNFVAAVVVCSLVQVFIGKDGPITLFLTNVFGLDNQNWLANAHIPIFWIILLLMGIWQGIGWGSIMYVAAISTVSGDLHEAAAIDGATRGQRLFRITIPCILPTVAMMFVIGVGTCFVSGFDSILLLYMPSTYPVADTVFTYTYRMAFGTATNYSLSAASGLFQSVVSTVLLVGSNTLSRKVAGSSLF